jgi:hypothetical protein
VSMVAFKGATACPRPRQVATRRVVVWHRLPSLESKLMTRAESEPGETPAFDGWCSFVHPAGRWSLVFDDDGAVAYAYLCEPPGFKVVTHVWLYGRGPRWEMVFQLVAGPRELEVRWEDGHESILGVELLIRGQRFARLEPRAKPGWSILARKDDALTRTWRPEEDS